VATGLYSLNGKEPVDISTVQKIRVKHLVGEFAGQYVARTDPSSYTDEELADAGYSGPYVRPAYDNASQYIVWNRATMEWDVFDHPVDDPPTPEELLFRLIQDRNELLKDSDWRMLPDAPITTEQKKEWKAYRQKLRDFPLQFYTAEDENNIVIKHLDDGYKSYDDIKWPNPPHSDTTGTGTFF
tara:strand:- start:75 stop:626 length:552 start_codon:yes stop_codon:yes gene_type:complete